MEYQPQLGACMHAWQAWCACGEQCGVGRGTWSELWILLIAGSMQHDGKGDAPGPGDPFWCEALDEQGNVVPGKRVLHLLSGTPANMHQSVAAALCKAYSDDQQTNLGWVPSWDPQWLAPGGC